MARFKGIPVEDEAPAKKPRFGGIPVKGAPAAASGKPSVMDQVKAQAHNLRANQTPLIDAVMAPQEEGWETPGEGEPGIPVVTDLIRSLYPFERNEETGKLRGAVPKIIPDTVDAAGRVLSLPKEVAAGDIDPMSDEGIARGVEFTMMTTPGAPKAANPKLPGNPVAMVGKTEAPTGIPTAAEFKAIPQKAYDQAKGSEISPAATPDIVNKFKATLDAEGLMRPDGKMLGDYSLVKKAMKDVQSFEGKPMTFEQFQRLEETLQNAAGSKTQGEGRIGKILLDQFDAFFEALPETAFTKGNAAAAKAGYEGGKAGWAQYSKLKKLEKAIYDAELSKSGFAEGLKDEFRKILKNDRKALGFTAEEKAAMKAFVQKGGTLENIRGWLSGLRGLPGVVAGGLSGGVIGAVGVPVVGAAAKAMGNAGAKKTVNQLRAEVAASKTTAPPLPPVKPYQPTLAAPVVNAGVRGLGVQAGDQQALQAALRSLRLEAGSI